jgi:tRNA modification GTPase
MYDNVSRECAKNGGHTLLVLNKKDLSEFPESVSIPYPFVRVSCKNYDGIEELKTMLISISLPHHDSTSSSVTITNARHKDALERALTSVRAAKKTIESGLGGDFASVDLRGALNYLGEIIGLTTPDDILNNIFSNFCIGK